MTARRHATLPALDENPDAGSDAVPFWRRKKLDEMTRTEWESLCDGCGKCCLVKLEYLDTGEIEHSSIACRLLDLGTCRCSDYPNRQKKVHDCIRLTPNRVTKLKWLPASCGYRLVAEGRDLYWWHPLISGDPETVHEAGVSVRGRVVREARKLKPEDHIVTWIDDVGRKAPKRARTRKSSSGRGTT